MNQKFTPNNLFTLALLLALGACEPGLESELEAQSESEPPPEIGTTIGALDADMGKYFDVAPGGALTLRNTYTNWGRQWHLMSPGGGTGQIVLYHLNGTLKVMEVNSQGTYTVQATHQLEPNARTIVRGQLGGSSRREIGLHWIDGAKQGYLQFYQVEANGTLTFVHETYIGVKWDNIIAGRWSSPSTDDVLAYDKQDGHIQFWTSGAGGLTASHSRFNNQKNWEVLIPGSFGHSANSTTDVLFYNQDSGIAKFTNFDNTYNLTTIRTETNWPVTENLLIVPGDFGGASSETDLLLYNQIARTGTFLLDAAGGGFTSGAPQNWADKWSHILPINQPSAGTNSLLFYSNRYDVKVKFVRVRNNNGTMPGDITAASAEIWIDTANKTYHPAGINLVWDGSIVQHDDSLLNVSICADDSAKARADCKVDPDFAGDPKCNGIAFEPSLSAEDSIVVLVTGVPTNYSCSSRARWMRLTGWGTSGGGKTYYWDRFGNKTDRLGNILSPNSGPQPNNIGLFPHELGHFFRLIHTNTENDVVPASLSALDDLDSAFHGYDTPADPGNGCAPAYLCPETGLQVFWDYWHSRISGGRCNDAGGEPQITLGGVTQSFNPDRHTVMDAGLDCDRMYRLTPSQIQRIRSNLFVQYTTDNGGRLYLVD